MLVLLAPFVRLPYQMRFSSSDRTRFHSTRTQKTPGSPRKTGKLGPDESSLRPEVTVRSPNRAGSVLTSVVFVCLFAVLAVLLLPYLLEVAARLLLVVLLSCSCVIAILVLLRLLGVKVPIPGKLRRMLCRIEKALGSRAAPHPSDTIDVKGNPVEPGREGMGSERSD